MADDSDSLGISTVLIVGEMLMKLVEQLEEAGANVTVTRRAAGDFDAVVNVDLDNVRATFAVEVRSRAPYPNELDAFLGAHKHLGGERSRLLFAPAISEGLGQRLIGHGWSWADSRGNFELRAPGIRLRNRAASTATTRSRRSSLSHGRGALTIIRFLIREGNEWGTFGPTHLANVAGVRQPRASQVLANLASSGLAERVPEGWRVNRDALLDTFLAQYRGAGGTEVPLYSHDAPTQTAARIVDTIDPTHSKIAVSADVGPHLISPWRSPSIVIAYVEDDTHVDKLQLVRARTRADANVLLRVPDDTSVFRSTPLEADILSNAIPLADETQMIWDLQDLGGEDRVEAAGELRKWLLTSH
ncbi:MAG TPA: hypothetical protein VHJ34_05690 [Actinomycetota bacterium]|nr:hypothetical protein [Actinomycetota bacterium]